MLFKIKKILDTLFIVFAIDIFVICIILFNARYTFATSNTNLAAVIGDSYAGKMKEVDNKFEFKYYFFPVPGIDQEKNEGIFNQCLYDEDVRYILFTTSVNDQGRQLSPEIFKQFLYTYAERAKDNNKYLFFHTYMNVPHDHIKQVHYKSTDYDNALKEIANAYSNVYYIDMNNFNDNRFILKDQSHFNNLFHASLKAKYLDYINDINEDMYGIKTANDIINDKNLIAITGNSYANCFYSYENHKKYNMIEFASPNKTIFGNNPLILKSLNSTAKYVLLSIGINDFKEKSDISDFEDLIRNFANIATENSKILFFHTYMNYIDYDDNNAKKNNIKNEASIKDYDNILKKISEEYNKVIYIDMSEYNNQAYMLPDLLHYGVEFNDALYNKLDAIIRKINYK